MQRYLSAWGPGLSILVAVLTGGVERAAGDYLVGAQQGILRYDNAGNFLGTFASLNQPGGMDLGDDGYLYVTLPNAAQVLRYQLNGTLAGTAVSAQQLAGSTGFDVDYGHNGNLYVSLGIGNKVGQYATATGNQVGPLLTSPMTIPMPGSINFAAGVLDRADGSTLVCSLGGNSIVKFSNGVYTGPFVMPGANGLNGPNFMAVLPNGTVVVDSATGNAIQEYSSSGAFLGSLQPPLLGGQAQMLAPMDASVGADGALYIVGENDNRIWRLDTSSNQFSVFISNAGGGLGSPLTIQYVPEPGTLGLLGVAASGAVALGRGRRRASSRRRGR